MGGSQCEGFLDTAASKSFINQEGVDRLQLKASLPSEDCIFLEVTCEQIRSDRVIMRSMAWDGRERSMGGILKGPPPCEVGLGFGSSTPQTVKWSSQPDKLRAHGNAAWGELTVAQSYAFGQKSVTVGDCTRRPQQSRHTSSMLDTWRACCQTRSQPSYGSHLSTTGQTRARERR